MCLTAAAGHVSLFVSNIVFIFNHKREGPLMPLGVSSAQASRFLPRLSTFASQDLPDLEALAYCVMVGPAGIPSTINARMQQALRQILGEAPVQARMAKQGAEIVASSLVATEGFIRGAR